MVLNVLSWKEALKQGFEPRLYSYATGDIPLGNVEAVLDFKIWAQKVMGISCYFTERSTGKKFLLTVYYRDRVGYCLPGNKIDFSFCATATGYCLMIYVNKNGNVWFFLR